VIVKILPDKMQLGEAAATQAAAAIGAAIAARGAARIIAATGASQFEFLDALVKKTEIDWSKVEMFHLDEYIGLSITHPASFRKYLLERLIEPTGIGLYHLLDGEGDPVHTCQEVSAQLQRAPIDVAFVGIGENGHLAFNDPPANFETEEPYLIVDLDEDCRRQQLGEGWFPTLSDVPTQAISMSVQQILKAREIVCVVPDARKATAVRNCLLEEVSPHFPASILRRHENVVLYLDPDSSARWTDEKATLS
jgi:glucosamine-6-phosphate deaminase